MASSLVTPRRRGVDLPYTEGWFQIGWSDELGPGQLKKITQFGQVYTLFRGEDGRVGVIDDVCPHLGAHFSEGGCVKGNSVRCPYHHWSFDRTGQCTNIPYAEKIPVKARVRGHTVVERYGLIFMYRNKAGTAPSYDLPEIEGFDETRYAAPAKYDFKIRIRGQDIMENSVDSPHFYAVHGHAMPKNDFRVDGKSLRVTQTSSVKRFGTVIDFRLDFHLIEPGFHYVHFPQVPGTKALVFSSIVPIDNELTNHRMSIWIMKTPYPGWSRLVRRFLIWQMMKTYQEDMQIWEHKEYLPNPVLCEGDGAVLKLRKWYSQFYEAPDAVRLPMQPAEPEAASTP